MKAVLLSIFFVLNIGLGFAQNLVSEDIGKLKSFILAEDYRSAMTLGDELIGKGVKQGSESDAAFVYLYRGIAKYKFEIFDDAIIDFKQALAFNSELAESYLYISEIYYSLRRYPIALENIIYYIEKKPDDTHGLALKSKCLLELGEPMAAKIIIQKAISLVSSDAELYYVRAAINSALGEDEKACKDAQISHKLGYKNAVNLMNTFCKED